METIKCASRCLIRYETNQLKFDSIVCHIPHDALFSFISMYLTLLKDRRVPRRT